MNPLLHGGDINPYAGEVETLPPFVVSESRLTSDPLLLATIVLTVVWFATKGR